jgi:hypothetical protein
MPAFFSFIFKIMVSAKIIFLQVDAEHYVFSTFGVLHVYADKTSDCLPLAAWQKESVLWTAAHKIPFFRNYLVKKAFTRCAVKVTCKMCSVVLGFREYLFNGCFNFLITEAI